MARSPLFPLLRQDVTPPTGKVRAWSRIHPDGSNLAGMADQYLKLLELLRQFLVRDQTFILKRLQKSVWPAGTRHRDQAGLAARMNLKDDLGREGRDFLHRHDEEMRYEPMMMET